MRIGRIVVMTFGCVIAAAAQDRVTVPLTDPSQPVTIHAKTLMGNIRVTAGTGRDLIVSSSDNVSGRRIVNDPAPPGMTRIGGRPGLDIEEDHNVVTVSSSSLGRGGDLIIETPVNTSLQLKAVTGSIDVTGVHGDQEVESVNGSITLTNVSGSVVAHTVNGGVTVSLDRITENKPMSFTSLNGKVDVSLPPDTKARLRLKSDRGSIYSDFEVKIEPEASKPTIADSRNQNGKYKISVDRAVTGTINGGGPEYTFQTMNGNILIHRK